jgi:hypothetical protein
MTDIQFLDLIASLIFIYFLLCLISNSAFEIFSSVLKMRPELLRNWLEKTFGSDANHFLKNELLDGLSKDGEAPSYMKAKDFTSALIDLITGKTDTVPTMAEIKKSLQETSNTLPAELRRSLLVMIAKAEAKAKSQMPGSATPIDGYLHFVEQVEDWFDGMMERLSGSYKRRSMKWTAGIAAAIVLSMNVDTLSLITYFHSNKDVTARIAESAYKATHDTIYQKRFEVKVKSLADADDMDSTELLAAQGQASDSENLARATRAVGEIRNLQEQIGSFIPLGWRVAEFSQYCMKHYGKKDFRLDGLCLFLISKLTGLVLTILAIMLGAPFWFDVLTKVANIRNSLKPLTAQQTRDKVAKKQS